MSGKNDDQDDPASASWHLDKRIPIALILTLALQTGTIIWWAAGVTARLEQVERRQEATAPQADRLTRVEVRIEAIQDGIARIERAVQRPGGN